MVKLNRCVGNYNTLNDLFSKVYVQNKTEDLNLSVLNPIKKMNQKYKQRIYHVNVNVNLMEESVIQIKSGIKINVDASVKNIHVKNIIFGTLLHVVTKIVNI